MRDGARLFTVVYLPKDNSKPVPFLIERTPYSVGTQNDGALRYGVDFLPRRLGPDDLVRAGYIFVKQDVRGRYMSEGRWTEMQPHHTAKKSMTDVDASSDMHDTVEWLLKNVPGHNGRVGIWGVSYPGFYAAASIIDSHPAIKAASPQAPVTDLYMNDDAYHNGAFMLAANYSFYAYFKPQANPTDQPRRDEYFDYGTASGYDYFLKLGTLRNIVNSLKPEQRPYFAESVNHPNLDAYWKARNISAHLKNIKAAVLTVGGWYDAEDPQGPFSTYRAIEQFNPGATNLLVVGPWVHGGWSWLDGERIGHVHFGAATAEHYRKNIVFPFFEKYLRGDEARAAGAKPLPELAKVTAFETGTNVWRQHDAWPPRAAQPRTLYFQPGGKLAFQAPQKTDGPAYDEYTSDPARPVPFLAQPALVVPQDHMVADQRFAATRPDVLVYQTDVLEDDLTLVGPLEPRLFVSTTGTDADWVLKLIDVYPDAYPQPAPPSAGASSGSAKSPLDVTVEPLPLAGYQQLVRGEPMRGKFRNSFEKPEPFVPGAVTAVNFRMPDVAHTFRRGHRIMVQVQSSWFPLIDRNPQTFVNIPDAKPEDFRAATQRIWRSSTQASGIAVLVLPGIGQ
jgi:putative CocE/NonD family hydrolase